MKPGYRITGSRVETQAVSSYGYTGFNWYSPTMIHGSSKMAAPMASIAISIGAVYTNRPLTVTPRCFSKCCSSSSRPTSITMLTSASVVPWVYGAM